MKNSKQTAKRRGLTLKTVFLFIILLAAVLIYGVIRYLAEAGVQPFDREVLLSLLPEVIPALAALVIAFVITLVLQRREVSFPSKTIEGQLNGYIARKREKKPFEQVGAGALENIENALVKADLEIDRYLDDRIKESEEIALRENEEKIARMIGMQTVPTLRSDNELSYGLGGCVQFSDCFGGDYYDYFPLDKRRVCFALGDVWGTGLPAALFSARLKELVREYVCAAQSLTESVEKINAELFKNNPYNLGATLFVGIFYPETSELRYLNAGHCPPVLIGEKDGFLPCKTGTPLGFFENASFVEELFELKAGSALLLYTNGVTEAMDGKGNFFGTERLISAVRSSWNDSLGAEHIVRTVKNELQAFCGERKLADDYAFLAVYYPLGLQKMFRPVTSELEVMRDLMFGWLKNDPRRNKVYLACEEIFTNIVNHSGASSILLDCQREGDSLVVRFTDDGEPFNPLPVQQTERSFYDYGQGGMGMAIIRQIAGEVFYRTKDNRNVLTVRFPVYEG